MKLTDQPRISGVLERVAAMPEPFASITAYDYPTARLIDEAGMDVILVGDSLGMMVAGMEDTTGVTLDQMVYHTEIVARGVESALLISDLPINSYRTAKESVASSFRLIDAGADAVKLEGGTGQIKKIDALIDNDIPVVGHVGMLPQRVREEGGYKKKGKTEREADALFDAAGELQDAGVVMIVLESVKAETARRITESLKIPTIGIGAGSDCTGQIRVLHDVIGAYPWFVPPFAKTYTDVAEQISEAVKQYRTELK